MTTETVSKGGCEDSERTSLRQPLSFVFLLPIDTHCVPAWLENVKHRHGDGAALLIEDGRNTRVPRVSESSDGKRPGVSALERLRQEDPRFKASQDIERDYV